MSLVHRVYHGFQPKSYHARRDRGPDEHHLSDLWNQAHIGHAPFVDREHERFFSKDNVELIGAKVTQHLHEVHPEGKRIVVTPRRIREVMGLIYQNKRGRHVDMTDLVISTIVGAIRDEIEQTEVNRKYDIWVTQYDENPRFGLRAHPPIKLNHRRPKFEFNMIYG